MPEVNPYVDTVKIDILKHLTSVRTRMDIEMYMAAIMRDKKMKGLYPAAIIPIAFNLYYCNREPSLPIGHKRRCLVLNNLNPVLLDAIDRPHPVLLDAMTSRHML